MLKILIADDHAVTRRGIREILKDEFDDVSIEEVEDGLQLIKKLSGPTWDLILLDIIMPGMNVVEVLTEIRRQCPDTPVLVLTSISEMEYVFRTLKAGANGYISKQHVSDELVLAIKKVLAGETYLTGDAVTKLAATLRDDTTQLPHHKLSKREMEVFLFIARGFSVKEIGGELNLSEKTVGTYLSRVREKTGLVSYVEITRYALQNRLVS